MNNSPDDIKKSIKEHGAQAVLDALDAFYDDTTSLSRVGLVMDTNDGREVIKRVAIWVWCNDDGDWRVPSDLPDLLQMSEQELADAMNITKRTLMTWLGIHGVCNITKRNYQKLHVFCAERGVDLDYPSSIFIEHVY